MNFYWKYIFGVFFLGALFLLENLLRNTTTLKEKINENYNLKKKIEDLKEDNKFLKESVMELKGGELTKGELIKSVQALINKEEDKKTRKITEYNKEIAALFDNKKGR